VATQIKQVSQREDRTPDLVVGMGLNIRLIRASKVRARALLRCQRKPHPCRCPPAGRCI
jgi:hypothetical protein